MAPPPLGCRPRSVLPHVDGAVGDVAGADSAASPTSSPSMAAATPRASETDFAPLQRMPPAAAAGRGARAWWQSPGSRSSSTARELHLPPEKFVLIPNGTDLAFSDTAASEPDGPPVIASIGRLESYKGHHRVIAAFPAVLEREPEARLLVVGTGPRRARSCAARRRSWASPLGSSSPAPRRRPPARWPTLLGGRLAGRPDERVRDPSAGRAGGSGGRSPPAGRRRQRPRRAGTRRLRPRDPAGRRPRWGRPGRSSRSSSKSPSEQRPKLTSWDECAAELLDLYRSIA